MPGEQGTPDAQSTDDTNEDDYEAIFQEEVDKSSGKLKLDEETELEVEDTDPTDTASEDDEDADKRDESTDEHPDKKEGDPQDDGSWEDRYRHLQSFTQKQVNAVNAEKAELEAKLKELEEKVDSSGNPDKDDRKEESKTEEGQLDKDTLLKDLSEEDRLLFEDNPALLDMMVKVSKTLGGSDKKSYSEEDIEKVVEARLAAREQDNEAEQIARKQQEDWETLNREMPEASEIYENPVFQGWLKANPELADSIASTGKTEVQGAKAVLSYFQERVALEEVSSARKRSALKSTSTSPKSKSTSPAKGPADDDYEAAFKYYEKRAKSS